MRKTKVLIVSFLAILFSMESFAQHSASELFRAYTQSMSSPDPSDAPKETPKENLEDVNKAVSKEEDNAAAIAESLSTTAALPVNSTRIDSIARIDSVAILDSLMREENRYHLPESQLQFTQALEKQIFQNDSILNVLASQILPYSGPRDPSDIMRYYRRYDLMKTRVRPRAAQLPDSIDYEYPAANPLFMPLVFNSFKEKMDMPECKIGRIEDKDHWHLPKHRHEIPNDDYTKKLRSQLMRQLEREHLYQFEYCSNDIPEYERIEILLEAKKPMQIESMPTLNINPVRQTVHQIRPEYTYWKFRGRMSAQMTQTYISKNWSSGGESNMSGLASIYWKANYDDKKNIQFDNFVDWKVGVNSNEADTLRGYNISTDQLQLSSKLGIKAVKNWYYSAQAEFITQTLTNYQTNTYTPKSALLSPAKLFVSVGMDFKKNSQNGKHKLSVLMTPLTYRMNFLMDTINFSPSSYGINPGKRIGHEFGFKVTANYDWKLSEDISGNSYLYYYSDFSYIDTEWKNTINFKVNQYLSTQLFIHTKLNDREFKRSEGKKLIQLKEFLSFGFTYFW